MTDRKYYKVTNLEEVHHGHTYCDGLNVLEGDFEEEGSCVPGGFYFTTLDQIHHYYYYGVHIREIELPVEDEDFRMVQDGLKWRANKIILGKKWSLFDPSTYQELGLSPYLNSYLLDYASAAGRVDVLETWAKVVDDQDSIWHRSLREICSDCQFQKSLLPYSHRALDDASAHGHVDVLQWWFNRYIFHGNQFRYTHMAIDNASEKGHRHVLDWWWWKKVNHDIEFRYHYAIDWASARGKLETLDWWYHKALAGDINFLHSSMAVDQAAIHEEYDTLEWWHRHRETLGWKCTEKPIIHACQYGKIDILDWFFTKYCLGELEMIYTHLSFDTAAVYGRIDVMEWFFHRRSVIELRYSLQAYLKGSESVKIWWRNKGLPLRSSKTNNGA